MSLQPITNDDNKPCFFQDNFVPLKDANVNIRTHALQYGTACFGGIRAYWNQDKQNLFVFRLQEHYQRLKNSAHILHMRLPYSVEELTNITVELLRKGEWKQNVYLRPILYKSDLGLSPRVHSGQDSFAIYAIGLDDYLDTQKGLSTSVSSWTRISDNSIPTRAKVTGGYINSALAKSEAAQNNCDEAICLNREGYVSEGSAENIFLVQRGTLVTPDVSSDILEGITRRSLIEMAKDENIPLIERKVARTEIYVSDEAFFCGTGVQVAWIKSVDGRIIGNGQMGEVTRKIQNLFFDTVKGNNPRYTHWLTPVF